MPTPTIEILQILGVGGEAGIADRRLALLKHVGRLRQRRGGDGEGHLAWRPLRDHVVIDPRPGERAEDRRRRAGRLGQAAEGQARLVLVVGDAGDQLAFHGIFLQRVLAHDQGAGPILERGEHLQRQIVAHREADRAGLQHLGADRSELEHFLIGDDRQLARARHDPGIGGVDAVDVGVDVAAVGVHRRGDGDGRRVGAAPAQRGEAAVGGDALEAGNDRDPFFVEHPLEHGDVDPLDHAGGVAAGADRQLPAHIGARVEPHPLQRDRQEAAGHLLARGDHHVIFARVVERGGLAAELDQPVGLAGHRRHHHRHLIARLRRAPDEAGDMADALAPRHRGAAELHHDARHGAPEAHGK